MRMQLLSGEWRRHAQAYLSYLRGLAIASDTKITTAQIAQATQSPEKEVRQNLAAITDSGLLRTDYPNQFLFHALEEALGYYNLSDIILLGSGELAGALLSNASFEKRGFRLVAAFSENPSDRRYRPYAQLRAYCEDRHIHLGIVATEPELADEAGRLLEACGVLGIWNVSGAVLETMPNTLVENEKFGEHEEIRENTYVSLSICAIAKQLANNLGWNLDFMIED